LVKNEQKERENGKKEWKKKNDFLWDLEVLCTAKTKLENILSFS
jgi:hypothetical protein